jgi:transposase
VGREPRRAGQPGDDEPGDCSPRLDLEKKSLAASEQDAEARRQWWEAMADRDAGQFVFVDESSANVTLSPRYARAPHNERAHGHAPRNYDRNTTLVAALTPVGLQAPMTLEGAMTSDAFAAYVRTFLLPTLVPGQIVICDNLSVHKRADIRALIEGVGCELIFLPAYSPDFNPIEHAFSKLKQRLRRLAARTQETLEAAIADALATITTTDARHWFAHVGYDLALEQSL